MNARDLPIRAAVSGSFRRAMPAIQDAVAHLSDNGVVVLSPADPRVVDHFGDFLFVASDVVRAIRSVQSRHLAAIRASDFLWLVAPEGYIGQSAAMEVGFAVAAGTPIYAAEVPGDLTLRQYVTIVPGLDSAIGAATQHRRNDRSVAAVLVDPKATITDAHDKLDVIEASLTRPVTDSEVVLAAAKHVRDALTVY